MVRREYVEKDHDCAGSWVVEAEEKERNREICELRSISPAKLPTN